MMIILVIGLALSVFPWILLYRKTQGLARIVHASLPYTRRQTDQLPYLSLQVPDRQNRQLVRFFNVLLEDLATLSKKLSQEQKEKEVLIESLAEGVVIVDAEMSIRYVNFVGSKMLGIPKRRLIGKSFPSIQGLATTSLVDKCRALLEAAYERKTTVTDSIMLGDSKKLYLDLIASPNMNRNGGVLVLQDKSSHHRVLEMGKDFVSNASHELRTPITIIKGFTETLQDMPDLPREMFADITEKIVRNCQRMDNLVKNLLTLADIENLSKNRFQECDLVGLAEACRQLVLSVHGDCEIEIHKKQEAVTVFADPDILELAIINLLDNGVKYSPKPAHIQIFIDQEEEDARIEISDRGIGISSQDIEHVFERFYTVNKAHSRRLGGAGLGLSIVKTIIEKHEGTIAVSSVPGSGTSFNILLPR